MSQLAPSLGSPEVPGYDRRGQEDYGHSDDGAGPREAEDGPGGRKDEGWRRVRGYLMIHQNVICYYLIQGLLREDAETNQVVSF